MLKLDHHSFIRASSSPVEEDAHVKGVLVSLPVNGTASEREPQITKVVIRKSILRKIIDLKG